MSLVLFEIIGSWFSCCSSVVMFSPSCFIFSFCSDPTFGFLISICVSVSFLDNNFGASLVRPYEICLARHFC